MYCILLIINGIEFFFKIRPYPDVWNPDFCINLQVCFPFLPVLRRRRRGDRCVVNPLHEYRK